MWWSTLWDNCGYCNVCVCASYISSATMELYIGHLLSCICSPLLCVYVRTYVRVSPLACYSTVGELFDHGLDSWAAILLPLSIYSGLGIGKPWGTNAVEGYPALLCKTGGGGERSTRGVQPLSMLLCYAAYVCICTLVCLSVMYSLPVLPDGHVPATN